MKHRNPAPDRTDSGKPPRKLPKQKTVEDNDDYEDGDIATPKRDRDDEQQGL